MQVWFEFKFGVYSLFLFSKDNSTNRVRYDIESEFKLTIQTIPKLHFSFIAFFYGTCHYSVGEDNVVNRNEHEFDGVTNESHNDETHEAGVHNLHVLFSIGLLALFEENLRVTDEVSHLSHDVVLLFLHLLFARTLLHCLQRLIINYNLELLIIMIIDISSVSETIKFNLHFL